MSNVIVAGVDMGSTTTKALLLKGGEIVGTLIGPTDTNPTLAGKQVLDSLLSYNNYRLPLVKYIVATGYGRVSAPFADKIVTEISCHGRGAYKLSPEIRTVIDIGGQDAKVVSLGEDGKIIDFVMNDKCASGTGRFLESIAQLVLHVPLEEMDELSLKSTKTCQISSTCTVFAQTEIVSLLASEERKEDIIAGLNRSIANRVVSMAGRVAIKPIAMITGGVAKNIGVKQALEKELNMEVVVPIDIDPQLVGALGAALIADEIFTNSQ